MSGPTRRLCICLLNVSEARKPGTIQAITQAALKVNEGIRNSIKSSGKFAIFSYLKISSYTPPQFLVAIFLWMRGQR